MAYSARRLREAQSFYSGGVIQENLLYFQEFNLSSGTPSPKSRMFFISVKLLLHLPIFSDDLPRNDVATKIGAM